MIKRALAEAAGFVAHGVAYVLCLPATLLFCYIGRRDAKRISRALQERDQRIASRNEQAAKASAFSDSGARRPLSPEEGREDASIKHQVHSRLLQLPPEIRRMIWLFHLGDRDVHLWPKYGESKVWDPSLYHRICRANCLGITKDGSVDRGTYFPIGRLVRPDTMQPMHLEDWEHRIGQADRTTDDLLALTRTCQQVYLETLPLLYQTNTFIVSSSSANSITPWSWGRFHLITKLRIGFWLHQPPTDPEWSYAWYIDWRTIAALPALQSLIAHIGCNPYGASWLADNEMEIFQEIRAVTRPKEFILVLNWMKRPTNENLWPDMPCQIVHQWKSSEATAQFEL